jgi:hypothetical protein
MNKIISYMSVAQGLLDNFWQVKVGLEKDLKIALKSHKNHSIVLDEEIFVSIYDDADDKILVKAVFIKDDAVYIGSHDYDYHRLVDISSIDDFYDLCEKLGM